MSKTAAPAHALFSPSSAHKWMRCEGALAMEKNAPSTTSESADEGTVAHHIAAMVLTDGTFYARAYQGRTIRVVNGQVYERGQKMPPLLKGQRKHFDREFEVTEEMCEGIQLYVDAVRDRVEEYKAAGAVDVTMLIENRVNFSEVVGVEDQFGTSDTIIIVTWADGTSLIDIEDLKFGYRLVTAEKNEQLMVYALGALDQYGMLGNFTRARMVIHMPNRDGFVSDWECDVTELQAFAKVAYERAQAAKNTMEIWPTLTDAERAAKLTPGEKQCQWCKRKGDCPALVNFVEEVTGVEFENLDAETIHDAIPQETSTDATYGERLAKLRAAVPLLDIFCRGILATSDAFVLGGGKMPGWKAVMGKKGNRKWTDAKEAEDTMKAMRLKQDDMYSMKVISPTQAEKLLKKDSPRRWSKIEKLVTQSEGAPAVVEESDKRPPLEIKDPDDDFVALVDGDDMV